MFAVLLGCGPRGSVDPVGQLTELPGNEVRARISPDGKMLVFQHVLAGNSDIKLIDLQSKQITNLRATPDNESSPAWSPDNKHVVFVWAHDDSYGLYTIDTKTRKEQEIFFSDTLKLSGPSWSPDGRSIATTGLYKGKYYQWLVDSDAKNLRQLTFVGDEYWGKWSPDSKRLIYYTGKNDSVMTVHTETLAVASLSEDRYIGFYPEFSPKGHSFVFTSPRNSGSYNLWLAPASGFPIQQITYDHYNAFPSWHPQGQKLVFSRRVENDQLYQMNVSTGSVSRITSAGINTVPAVSASGKILFVRGKGTKQQVVLKNDSNEQLIGESFAAINSISWAKDEHFAAIVACKSKEINWKNVGLYLMDIESGETTLLDQGGGIRDPLWHPNNEDVYYSSWKESKYGLRQIWQVNAFTKAKSQLSDEPYDKWPTDVDPKGQHLLVTKRLDYGHFQVSRMNLATLNEENLLPMITIPDFARWNTDGTQIVFRQQLSRQFDLFTLDVATGEIKRLTNDAYKESGAYWLPDGESIIYSVNTNDLDLWLMSVPN